MGSQISALNCSGNPLHPGEEGRQHDRVTRETIRLAGLLGVERVVMMSGCPGAPGDAYPNWITVQWPAETRAILKCQWDEVLMPYWRDLVGFAANHGVRGCAWSCTGTRTSTTCARCWRCARRVGEAVGANYDPSHLMWMGADPIAAIRALGPAIYHVHAKDTRVNPEIAGMNSPLETIIADQWRERAWNYVTLGYGHGEAWWAEFVARWRRPATTTCCRSSTRTS